MRSDVLGWVRGGHAAPARFSGDTRSEAREGKGPSTLNTTLPATRVASLAV